jgi:hypothetical protein
MRCTYINYTKSDPISGEVYYYFEGIGDIPASFAEMAPPTDGFLIGIFRSQARFLTGDGILGVRLLT